MICGGLDLESVRRIPDSLLVLMPCRCDSLLVLMPCRCDGLRAGGCAPLLVPVPMNGPTSLTDRGLDAVERFAVQGVRSALLGDTAEARRISVRLGSARDSATSALFESAFEPMFALLEAGIASRRGDWHETRMVLEPAAERLHEPGFGFISDRFLVRWMLAEAYAQLGDAGSSIAQLEALLAERAFEPLHVLLFAPTHFKLARLNRDAGHAESATEHYTSFLAAFADPDPEYAWMVDEASAGIAP